MSNKHRKRKKSRGIELIGTFKGEPTYAPKASGNSNVPEEIPEKIEHKKEPSRLLPILPRKGTVVGRRSEEEISREAVRFLRRHRNPDDYIRDVREYRSASGPAYPKISSRDLTKPGLEIKEVRQGKSPSREIPKFKPVPVSSKWHQPDEVDDIDVFFHRWTPRFVYRVYKKTRKDAQQATSSAKKMWPNVKSGLYNLFRFLNFR